MTRWLEAAKSARPPVTKVTEVTKPLCHAPNEGVLSLLSLLSPAIDPETENPDTRASGVPAPPYRHPARAIRHRPALHLDRAGRVAGRMAAAYTLGPPRAGRSCLVRTVQGMAQAGEVPVKDLNQPPALADLLMRQVQADPTGFVPTVWFQHAIEPTFAKGGQPVPKLYEIASTLRALGYEHGRRDGLRGFHGLRWRKDDPFF